MAKSIMIQGTMSNAGKSLLVTGLCRIFKQDGYRVAPFKSQNMALNSYITRENLEIGRAQAVQAEACGIEPSVYMNPILLKPTTDMGSQVIVNGEVVGDMHASDYFGKKKEYLPIIRKAYETLASRADIIVIEGAGSPAEINLKQDDIVNMGMARLADAPVLLVGDIDRGGVFAQLIGTVMLLDKEEQDRIKGLIINKFRGDRKILEPGLSMLTERCGKPVLGVVPYLDVEIEEEDSLAGSLGRREKNGCIDIAVIRFPKISNFTDFQPLLLEPCVSVRYVGTAAELGSPDAVILPGTKNTISDLRWLRESGLEAAVIRLAKGDTIVFGICGGYQMLGDQVIDACGAEGGGSMRGIGLLPVKTVFEPAKTRTRMEGRTNLLSGTLFGLSDKKVSGYEIHMGTSHPVGGQGSPLLSIAEQGREPAQPQPHSRQSPGAAHRHPQTCPSDGSSMSACRQEGCCVDNVIGTYLHGIFDEEEFREAFVRLLHDRKGLQYEAGGALSYQAHKERQYDMLAAALRQSLDMQQIYRLLCQE